jgi:hypothetical protein
MHVETNRRVLDDKDGMGFDTWPVMGVVAHRCKNDEHAYFYA